MVNVHWCPERLNVGSFSGFISCLIHVCITRYIMRTTSKSLPVIHYGRSKDAKPFVMMYDAWDMVATSTPPCSFLLYNIEST